MLSIPDGFMLYIELEFDFLSPSEMLNPFLKVKQRLIRARPNFNMITDNPNVDMRTVDCSYYTHSAFKDNCHKKWIDLLTYTPMEYKYLETLA